MSLFGHINHWISNAVKTAGRDIGKATTDIQKASGAIEKDLSKIPVVGAGLRGLYDIAFQDTLGLIIMGGEVISGERIDKVIMGQLKSELQDFKDVGGYVQMVVTFVPGIGTGVGAAIGAGLAIANGQPISQALMAGIKGALPGGPLAAAAFEVAADGITAGIEHRTLNLQILAKDTVSSSLQAVGIPQQAADAISGGIQMIASIAHGTPIDTAFITGISAALPLPDSAKTAIDSGATMLDDLATKKPIDLKTLGGVVQDLPLPDDIKAGLNANPTFTNLSHALAQSVMGPGQSALPVGARKALFTGIAMGQGQAVQNLTSGQFTLNGAFINKLRTIGQQAAQTDPTIAAARKLVA